jgi:Fe2+ transport system protein FeoA
MCYTSVCLIRQTEIAELLFTIADQMVTQQNAEKTFRSDKVEFLHRFPKGSHGTIIDMTADTELQGRLMGMGLFVGTRFKLLQGGGSSPLPLLLAVGETRIALGPEIAGSILVEQ